MYRYVLDTFEGWHTYVYLSGWILTRFCNAYIHITFPCMYSIISYRIKGLTCIFLKTQYPSSLEPRTFSKWEFGVSRSGVKYMRCISGSSWILATKVLLTYILTYCQKYLDTKCLCICRYRYEIQYYNL